MQLPSFPGRTFGVACSTLLATVALGQTWTIRPLSGGLASVALDVNDLGVIVGNVLTKTQENRAAIWDSAGYHLLPKLGTYSESRRINNAGQVVGYAIIPDANSPNGYAGRAVLWERPNYTLIPTLGGLENFAYGINDHGVVCGQSYAEFGSHAFVWSKDRGLVDKGNLNPDYHYAYAGANGINKWGTIVGTGYDLMEPYHATMAKSVDKTVYDITYPGGRNVVAEALAINDNGVKVGYSSNGTDPGAHAAIFDGKGGYTDLGTFDGMPDSVATDVANNGDIVGYAYGFNDTGEIDAAFLYRGGKLIDLKTMIPKRSGWSVLYAAYGVNEKGLIVGSGLYYGVQRAFVIDSTP